MQPKINEEAKCKLNTQQENAMAQYATTENAQMRWRRRWRSNLQERTVKTARDHFEVQLRESSPTQLKGKCRVKKRPEKAQTRWQSNLQEGIRKEG